jgi:Plasmid pRiA4b ORF-3-like protein
MELLRDAGASADLMLAGTRVGSVYARSAAVRLDSLTLEPNKPIAYVFDFGDSWHVMLELREIVPLEPGARYPKLLDRRREPPPQYTYEDEVDE